MTENKLFSSLKFLSIFLLIMVSGYHVCVEYGFLRDFCALTKISSVDEYTNVLFAKKKSCANPIKSFGISLPLWSCVIFSGVLICSCFIKRKKSCLALLMIMLVSNSYASDGKIVNPITDVCWGCVFPITVSGVNVTPGQKDFEKSNTKFCFCAGIPPKPGLPMTYWEPCKLVDVTRHAYKLLGLGGISIGKESIKNRGTVGLNEGGKHSFYQVHFYSYPVFEILKIFTDFGCIEKGEVDAQYLSELDPTWNDDGLSLLVNSEAALFGNIPAQAACAMDCIKANIGSPSDKLFWCAGCQGSLYPFTGNVSHHIGGLQASSLLVHRVVAKLHRCRLLKGYPEGEYCEAQPMPILKKSLYKTQLVYPVAQTKGSCHPLGKSDVLWGAGKSFPVKGEDFVYFIWVKKHCCLSPSSIAQLQRGY